MVWIFLAPSVMACFTGVVLARAALTAVSQAVWISRKALCGISVLPILLSSSEAPFTDQIPRTAGSFCTDRRAGTWPEVAQVLPLSDSHLINFLELSIELGLLPTGIAIMCASIL